MLLSALHQRHAAITQLIHQLIVEEQKELWKKEQVAVEWQERQ